jgi:hypothetical protein
LRHVAKKIAAEQPVMGRPKKEIVLDLLAIEGLARIHCTVAEMASVLGVSKDTIERNPELMAAIQKGRDTGLFSLRRKQFELAEKGDRTMLIWLGKQLLGQHDIQRNEVTGPEGSVLRLEIVTHGEEKQRPAGNGDA